MHFLQKVLGVNGLNKMVSRTKIALGLPKKSGNLWKSLVTLKIFRNVCVAFGQLLESLQKSKEMLLLFCL